VADTTSAIAKAAVPKVSFSPTSVGSTT
jgi:hypothetical protein